MTSRLAGAPALAIFALGLLGPGASRPAHAQTEAAKSEARKRLIEGNQMYESAEFEAALQKYQTAFALYPSPKIYLNLGKAYLRLARHVDAIESFERFLAEAPSAPEDAKAEARRSIEEIRPRLSSIAIACSVPGAEVSIDGRSYGRTPLPGPIRAMPGPHLVVVERGGSPPFVQRVEPQRGALLTVQVRFPDAVVPSVAPPASGAPPAGGSVFMPSPGYPPPVYAPPPVEPLPGYTPSPGFAPLPAAAPPVLAPPAAVPFGPPPAGTVTQPGSPPPAERSSPFYATWWFWTGVGVVALAAGTASYLVLSGGEKNPYCGNVEPCPLGIP